MEENGDITRSIVIIQHKRINCPARLQVRQHMIQQYLPELPTSTEMEMRTQKPALRVIRTNEQAFMDMENARLRLSFAFCCPMNIFI